MCCLHSLEKDPDVSVHNDEGVSTTHRHGLGMKERGGGRQIKEIKASHVYTWPRGSGRVTVWFD